MKDEEKNLIENLFKRLKNTELNTSERDKSADDLIQKLVKNQPSSSYYMAQTILIQETAIKKMSETIEELKKRIETLNKEESNTKPSFLSNFFKTNPASQKASHDNNIWNKKETVVPSSYQSNPMMSASTTQQPFQTETRSSGFLSNALQTATGVAGGMILGNMLMNVFNHSKPEEEVFDTMNKASLDHHDVHETPIDYTTNDSNLVNYEESESNNFVHHNELDSEMINDDIDQDDLDDDHFI